MKICTKEEVNQLLGKRKWYKGTDLLTGLKYLHGIDELSNIEDTATLISKDITIEARPLGFNVWTLINFKTYRVPLLFQHFKSWEIRKQKTVIEKESKSVLKRAIVGGVLLGGVGAVVGAMSGLKDKEVEKAINGVENILAINYNDHVLLFDCPNKRVEETKTFLNKYLDC